MRNFIKIKKKPKLENPTPKRDDWKRKRKLDRRDKQARRNAA
jgi:hypothetical protein